MNAMDEFFEQMWRNENLNPYALDPVKDRERRQENARLGACTAKDSLNQLNEKKRKSNRHYAHEGIRSHKCCEVWGYDTVNEMMALLRTDKPIDLETEIRIEGMLRTNCGHAYVDGTPALDKRWLKRKISRIIPKRFKAKPLPRSNLNFDV